MSLAAQQVRTIIISLPDLVDVLAAMDQLRKGKGLSAVESGVAEYENIQNVNIVGDQPPVPIFDGFNYTIFLFVVSG